MGKMRIDEYRVVTSRSASNVNAHRFVLILDGQSESGPVSRATIYFWPRRPDSVGYLAGSGAIGLLDDGDFRDWYDILRNEKPCYLFYTEGRSSNHFYHIELGTSNEPVGEGPRDYTP